MKTKQGHGMNQQNYRSTGELDRTMNRASTIFVTTGIKDSFRLSVLQGGYLKWDQDKCSSNICFRSL